MLLYGRRDTKSVYRAAASTLGRDAHGEERNRTTADRPPALVSRSPRSKAGRPAYWLADLGSSSFGMCGGHFLSHGMVGSVAAMPLRSPPISNVARSAQAFADISLSRFKLGSAAPPFSASPPRLRGPLLIYFRIKDIYRGISGGLREASSIYFSKRSIYKCLPGTLRASSPRLISCVPRAPGSPSI